MKEGRTGMGRLLCLALLILAACAQSAHAPGGAPGPDILTMESAEEALLRVEAELMAAEGRTVDFEVRSEGAFSASLEGQMVLGSAMELSLEASGMFGPDSVSLWVRGADGRMTWGNGEASAEDDLPPAFREAVVIAREDGGAAQPRPARLGRAPRPPRRHGAVLGRGAGCETVWLDAAGRLVGREQVVRFPGGEMRVAERYVAR